MVRLYGRNYSVITEKSKSSTLRFYATIESRYGGNRFTAVVRIRNGNFFVAPTVYHSLWLVLVYTRDKSCITLAAVIIYVCDIFKVLIGDL